MNGKVIHLLGEAQKDYDLMHLDGPGSIGEVRPSGHVAQLEGQGVAVLARVHIHC